MLAAWRIAPARAEQAPDVVVLCDMPVRDALVAAGQAWRARTRIPVRVFVAALEQNAGLVVRGARADIIVGIGAKRIDDVQLLGALAPGTPVVIGRNPVVLAVRGASAPARSLNPGDTIADILGPGRLGPGRLGPGRLGIVDTAFGSAGVDARIALSGIGLWPGLASRSSGAESTGGLKQMLHDGLVQAAALYRTDVAGDPTLVVAAIFPLQAQVVVAALAKNAESPNAKDFLAFLAGDGQPVLRTRGMEAP